MKTQDEIELLVRQDSSINPDCIEHYDNSTDPLHVVRKQQQRAISDSMLLVALYYGRKKRTYQDFSYTIFDRSLKNTVYEKFTDKLRGLTIIGQWNKTKTKFILITAYWNFVVKSRKRY